MPDAVPDVDRSEPTARRLLVTGLLLTGAGLLIAFFPWFYADVNDRSFRCGAPFLPRLLVGGCGTLLEAARFVAVAVTVSGVLLLAWLRLRR